MRALIGFDLDGTLIDSLPAITRCANVMLRAEGASEVDEGIMRGVVGRGAGGYREKGGHGAHGADAAGHGGKPPKVGLGLRY